MRGRPLIALLVLICCACAQQPAQAPRGAFSFGLIGDLPYLPREEQTLRDLIAEMNAQPLAFVAHDGDIKSGGSRCDDEVLFWNKQVFDSSRHPFIYVPGDNEWTDCHRASNGGFDPIERLARLREVFFPDDQSLGRQRLTLTRQSADPRYSAYRENVRWVIGNVMFVGVNVPGSNNNFGRTATADAEYRARNAADLEWLRQAFDAVRRERLLGIAIIMQADPFFELPRGHKDRRGFEDLLALLQSETAALGKAVLLVHGDTHFFRVDQPLLDSSGHKLANFTRLETFGSPALGWVRVSVDPADAKLFVIEPFKYAPRQ